MSISLSNKTRCAACALLLGTALSVVAIPATAQQTPIDTTRPAPPAGRTNSNDTPPANITQRVTKDLADAKVSPQSFAEKAAVINKTEIELGQLALKNSQDASVKKYAQQMVTDHSAADKKLKTVAAKENINLPQSLDPEHRALKEKLAGLKGEEFDKEYTKAMAEGHDKAAALFESASQAQQMPSDLRDFAASTLTTIKQHREHAHTLKAKEGA